MSSEPELFDIYKIIVGDVTIIAVEYAFINYPRPSLADRMIDLFDIDTDKDCYGICKLEL